MLVGHTLPLMKPPSLVAPVGTGNDSYTKLLLHADRENGSQFVLDSSPARHGYAGISGAVISNNTAKFGTTSLFFNAPSTATITFPNSPDWDFGYGDFTIDWWEWRGDAAGVRPVFVRNYNAQTYQPLLIGLSSGGRLYSYASSNNASWDTLPGLDMGPITVSTWVHFALVRKTGVFTSYRNGVLIASVSSANGIVGSFGGIGIGFWNDGSSVYYAHTYIDEFRISKGIARWSASFTPPAAPYGPDPDLKTRLLLHFDDANAATTFVDSSQYSRVLTTVGSVNVAAVDLPVAAPMHVFGTGAGYWYGASGGLHVAGGTVSGDHTLGASDFTLDCRARRSAGSEGTYRYLFGYANPSSATPFGYALCINPTTNVVAFYGSFDGSTNAVAISGTTALAADTYYHVAVTRSGNVWRLFVNGVQEATQTVAGTVYSDATLGITVGRRGGYTDVNHHDWVGLIDELRLKIGEADWTANFTPPTAAYTPNPDASTVLLLHGDIDSWFGDSSGINPATPMYATPSNLVGVVQTAPKFGDGNFAFPANGGMSLPHSTRWEFGLFDFTIDWWEQRPAPGGGVSVARDYPTTYTPFMLGYGVDRAIYMTSDSSGSLAWNIANGIAYGFGTSPVSTWQHLALTRKGTVFKVFVNGQMVNWFHSSAGIAANANALVLGVAQLGAPTDLNGRIDEFRISRVARWTANFPVPTAPYDPANPEIYDPHLAVLLHFDGTTFVDSSRTARPVTVVGTPTLSSAWSKFGGKSASFPGGGSWVSVPDSLDLMANLFPFTIDFWMKSSVDSPICGQAYFNSGADFQLGIMIAGDGSGRLRVQAGSGPQDSTLNFTSISSDYFNGVEKHVALVRNGNVFTIYKNGVADGSSTVAINIMNSTMPWAIGRTTTAGTTYNGYIDEFRISNVARWTANFTPPTSAYTA